MTERTKGLLRSWIVPAIPIVASVVAGVASGGFVAGRCLADNSARVCQLERRADSSEETAKAVLAKLSTMERCGAEQGRDVSWIKESFDRLEKKIDRHLEREAAPSLSAAGKNP